MKSLIVEEVKHVLDCQRQNCAATGCAEHRREQIVDVLLQSSLCKVTIIYIAVSS